jgi:D-ornithine/D-lysine decarboxylase
VADAMLSVRDGHLCVGGADLTELADRWGTPLYVYSERAVREALHELTSAFTARHAATEVYYASKACSNRWVLNVVRDAGVNVEVNSGGELHQALRAGFAPRQIVFNGVAKTKDEIERALACGVRALIVDSRNELERIAQVAAALQVEATVAPRIDVRVPALTHPGLETAHGGKAGIDRDDAVAAFRRAAADPWLRPAGLHLHVGSQITSLEPYRQAMSAALDLVDEVEAAAGVRLEFLDAGGGFAVPYADERAAATSAAPDYFRSALSFDDYAEAMCAELQARRPGLTLVLEPGRSVVAGAAVLLARVESEKTKGLRDAAGERAGEERWLTIDAGYNTLLEHTNYRWYFRSVAASRAAEPADAPFRLAGPLCDGGDVFMGDDDTVFRRFPVATTVGDLIAFRDCGAYTLEMMNPYNARPRAAAVAVTAGGAAQLIRRRETDEELGALDLAPGFPG